MKLLRGLGGLTTSAFIIMMFAPSVQADEGATKKFSTAALFHDSARVCDKTSQALDAKTRKEKQQAGLNIASAILQLAGNLAEKTDKSEHLTRSRLDYTIELGEELMFRLEELEDSDKVVDPDTLGVAEALFNFALDVINQENALSYIREQVSLLFNALVEKLPGLFAEAVQEQLNLAQAHDESIQPEQETIESEASNG